MANDAAQTFAERRLIVEKLIAQAETAESMAETGEHSAEVAGRMIVIANNRRIQAICEHLGLQAAEPDST